MKLNSLTNALPIVAAAYGRKFGVAVQVGGTVAQTDGLTIAIPAIGDDPVARTLAWGYLTHEAAHVRYTDFDAVRRTAAKGPLAKGILNILEDVRVENAILGPYPGARGTLDAVNGWLIEHDQLAAPGEGDAPPAVLGNALLVMAFLRYRGETRLAEAAGEAERVLRKTFPSRFVHRLLGLMAEIPGLGSTQDAADLTERIVALIEEEAQEPPPQPKPAPQSDSGDGEAAGGQDQVDDPEDSAGHGTATRAPPTVVTRARRNRTRVTPGRTAWRRVRRRMAPQGSRAEIQAMTLQRPRGARRCRRCCPPRRATCRVTPTRRSRRCWPARQPVPKKRCCRPSSRSGATPGWVRSHSSGYGPSPRS